MFPHTMTIYRHTIEGGQDKYSKQVVEGVYWNENNGMTIEGNGFTKKRQVTVITSQSLCNGFMVTWDIKDGDRIIKGTGDDITRLADIPNAFIVTNVAINECGSDVDNITITGN